MVLSAAALAAGGFFVALGFAVFAGGGLVFGDFAPWGAAAALGAVLAAVVGAACAGFGGGGGFVAVGEAEVDLLFGAVDTVDLDFDVISKADDASGLFAGEGGALGVEDEEVVGDGGEVDHAAHAEAGDVDEEAEVADFGDEGVVEFGGVAVELGLKVGVEFDVAAVAFGIGGVALGDADVVGHFGDLCGRGGHFVKEHAVDDEVGVTADGGGEVGVFFFGEAVVPEGFDGVAGAHEGAEEADL